MVSTQVLHQATSLTSNHANWVDGFFAELFAELYRDDLFAELYGPDCVAVSVSRPSNDPGHANRYAPNQNADALPSCSCRTVKLLMVWPPSTSTQRSPRHAIGSLRLRSSDTDVADVAPPKYHNRRVQIMSGFKGQHRCPIDHTAGSSLSAQSLRDFPAL